MKNETNTPLKLKTKELLLVLVFNQPHERGLRSIPENRLMFSLNVNQRTLHRMIRALRDVLSDSRLEEGLFSYQINFNSERFILFNRFSVEPYRAFYLDREDLSDFIKRKRKGGGSKVLPSRPDQRQGPSNAKTNPEEMSESNRATSDP